MPCYSPLQGFRSRFANKSGKYPIVFDRSDSFGVKVQLPCGQCIGCRLERSRQWAVRCMHEASLYDDNCFLTLTFKDESLPEFSSLDVSIFQKFMKRLRKRFPDRKIRFFHCGEYGEKYGRPHYHACIFNFEFPDKRFYKYSCGMPIYTSDILSELWSFGICTIGSLTFESAAYVARYIMKKVTGDEAYKVYDVVDFETGEVLGSRKPEYVTMSRRPGIAKQWIDKYTSDVYPGDFVVIREDMICRPPKYYDSQFELKYPSDFQKIKERRKADARDFADNNTPDRLDVREKVQLLKLKLLGRNKVY